MGNFRLAHSGTMDDVDMKMREAKKALEDLRADLNERRIRWQQIELITSIQFTSPEEGSLRKNDSRSDLYASRTSVCNNNCSVVNNHNSSSSGSLVEEEEDILTEEEPPTGKGNEE